MKQPGDEMKQPGGEMKQPCGDMKQPGGEMKQPGGETSQPGERPYSIQIDVSHLVTQRNRKFLPSVEHLTIRENVINYSLPSQSVMEAGQGDTAMTDPTPRGTTTSPGMVTTPRPARTSARAPASPPVRRRLADPSPEDKEVGGDCETEVNQCLSDRNELARTEQPGEAEPAGPTRGTRARRRRGRLKRLLYIRNY